MRRRAPIPSCSSWAVHSTPANFLVLNANTPLEAVRQRADVLASVWNGEYLFKRPEPSYEVELDLFRSTKPRHAST